MSKSITRVVTVSTTARTLIVIKASSLLSLIREHALRAHKLPEQGVRMYIDIPGGADWSNTEFEFSRVCIEYETHDETTQED